MHLLLFFQLYPLLLLIVLEYQKSTLNVLRHKGQISNSHTFQINLLLQFFNTQIFCKILIN